MRMKIYATLFTILCIFLGKEEANAQNKQNTIMIYNNAVPIPSRNVINAESHMLPFFSIKSF